MSERVALAVLALVAACHAGTTDAVLDPESKARAPVVQSFAASPATIVAGQSSTLTWAVTGAHTIRIDPDVGRVSASPVTVTPGTTTTYTLSAESKAGTTVATTTVTVEPAGEPPPPGQPPAAPPPPGAPAIASFTASPTAVAAGGSSTLSWGVTGATRVTLDQGLGDVTSVSSTSVTPATTTIYTLTATNDAGSSTATVTVTVSAAGPIAPGDPGGNPAVTFTLDSTADAHPISRFVYGYNESSPSSAPAGTTYLRLGGNRWTAYNWETNASNAGSDWNYQNDGSMSSSSAPAEAIRPTVAADRAAGLGTLVTLSMQGWVAKDTNGPVSLTAPQSDRFLPTYPRKGSAFVYPPSLTDGAVYQDELVARLDALFPGAWDDPAAPLHISLDNEPDLWSSTHAEVQRSGLTYAKLLSLSVALASAVKDVAPAALVFGPVSYGWDGFRSLQGASDSTFGSTGQWFLDWYLAQMKAAGDAAGRRLLDVLDLHWYSEARGKDRNGTLQNVASSCATCNDPGVQAARVQAPRSLWDGYVENSWITNNGTGSPIRLIPTLLSKIAASYPGTALAFTEYNYGGSSDISGAVATADTLGIFGKQGVFAATYWPFSGSDNRFIHGAFRSFRDFDGAGGAFGDTSFSAVSTDDSKASVYASYDSDAPDARVVVVAVNKTTSSLPVQLRLTHTAVFGKAQVYQLTSGSTYAAPAVLPTHLADVTLPVTNAVNLTLPAYSVTTLVLVP